MEIELLSRLVWSEKSAIIPTKNNYSNTIQTTNKQNLKTYCICGKLNDGLNTCCFVGKSVCNPHLFAWKNVKHIHQHCALGRKKTLLFRLKTVPLTIIN